LVVVRIGGQDPKYQLNRPLAIVHRRTDNLDSTAARFLELLTGSDLKTSIPELSAPGRRVPAATFP
jgi:hypothetical protein